MIFSKDPAVWLKDLFIDAGLSYSLSSFVSTIALVGIVILLSWLSNIIAKAIIRYVIIRVVKKSKSKWDDIIYEHKVFTRLSHFAPAKDISTIVAGLGAMAAVLILVFKDTLLGNPTGEDIRMHSGTKKTY